MRDGAGTTQITVKKEGTDPALFRCLTETPRESVVEVVGSLRRSSRAHRGFEVVPSSAEVIAPADVPLPLGVVDRVNVELDTRLNHRVLDLRKPAVREVFEIRAALLAGFREAFARRGYLEVETPKILRQGAEGGATLFPIDYFGGRAFLAQSPQLYKQMLIGAGFERVFEIAPAFRAEPSDTVRHLTEFTSLDAEVGYVSGPADVIDELEAVVRHAVGAVAERWSAAGRPLPAGWPDVAAPFPRIPFREAAEWLGRSGPPRDFGTDDERALGEIVDRKFGAPMYFLTEYPSAVKASTFYARRLDDRPDVTGYFDLDLRGLEIASGGLREHRRDRLEANVRAAGLDPASFAGYLEAFRYGMPPHGGWGLGIDRLVQSLCGLSNVREARLFPRDRYRLEP